jgi:hypothetical protein
MALTLLEAEKLNRINGQGDDLREAIIELYTGSSDILQFLPFDNIQGNALKYNREGQYPGIGFRGVNEAYTASTGILNPQTESLVIAGGDLDVDKYIIDTMGMQHRSVQEAMKVRALAAAWTKKFIKGDMLSDPRELDGLQARVVGDQKIAAGSDANGSELSLAKLDEAIDQTLNPTHLIMNKKMRRHLTVAARKTSVGGQIDYTVDQFGKKVTMYDGLPILIVDLDHEGNEILGFNEAATSGTATATSIYVVSMADGMLTGIQNGSVNARDLGELQDSPKFRTRVEWYNGVAIYNGRAVTRLWSISDEAVVA